MSRQQLGIFIIGLFLSAGLLLSPQPVAESGQTRSGANPHDIQKVLEKAVIFLKDSQQKDGGFSPKIAGPGITAIAVAALLRNGVSPQEPVLAKGLKYLEMHTKDDGGIYSKSLANYTTAVALMALKEANKNGKYDNLIKRASEFIRNIQHIGDDLNQGGFGYDKNGRPDLSNSAFSVE